MDKIDSGLAQLHTCFNYTFIQSLSKVKKHAILSVAFIPVIPHPGIDYDTNIYCND